MTEIHTRHDTEDGRLTVTAYRESRVRDLAGDEQVMEDELASVTLREPNHGDDLTDLALAVSEELRTFIASEGPDGPPGDDTPTHERQL